MVEKWVEKKVLLKAVMSVVKMALTMECQEVVLKVLKWVGTKVDEMVVTMA